MKITKNRHATYVKEFIANLLLFLLIFNLLELLIALAIGGVNSWPFNRSYVTSILAPVAVAYVFTYKRWSTVEITELNDTDKLFEEIVEKLSYKYNNYTEVSPGTYQYEIAKSWAKNFSHLFNKQKPELTRSEDSLTITAHKEIIYYLESLFNPFKPY